MEAQGIGQDANNTSVGVRGLAGMGCTMEEGRVRGGAAAIVAAIW